jgi:hypothetical protein
MIDFDKLKECHLLAEKLGIIIRYAFRQEDSVFGALYDVDELHTNLMKLEVKPRFNIGETVWFAKEGYMPDSFIIQDIVFDKDAYYCANINFVYFSQSKLYSTKKELINEQIRYWKTVQLDNELQQQ